MNSYSDARVVLTLYCHTCGKVLRKFSGVTIAFAVPQEFDQKCPVCTKKKRQCPAAVKSEIVESGAIL